MARKLGYEEEIVRKLRKKNEESMHGEVAKYGERRK
jgi:hypothetical protein